MIAARTRESAPERCAAVLRRATEAQRAAPASPVHPWAVDLSRRPLLAKDLLESGHPLHQFRPAQGTPLQRRQKQLEGGGDVEVARDEKPCELLVGTPGRHLRILIQKCGVDSACM